MTYSRISSAVVADVVAVAVAISTFNKVVVDISSSDRR